MLLHEELSNKVIGAAIEVHRVLGPGLLENAYEQCLCQELQVNKIQFRRQVSLPIIYKNTRLNCGYEMDIVVEEKIVLELKAVEKLQPIHEAQLMTYLRLSGYRVGILMNFNVVLLKNGMKRLVL